MLYAFFDDFQFSLFDFPHLSSFNACEELNHLIILYPLSPALMSIGGDTVPPITMVAPPLHNLTDDKHTDDNRQTQHCTNSATVSTVG